MGLLCFAIAATSGALLRFGMIYGLPQGLHLHHLRHAHSHLMYFGWATPAFVALMLATVARVTGRPLHRNAGRVLGLIFVVAILAFVAFILYGYQPVTVGQARIPLATVTAGLNVLAWYVFVALYWRSARGAPRSMTLRLWDAALIFMILASLGAWGLALVTALGIESAVLSLGLTHLFLDLFADGWFLLALLGVALLSFPEAAARRAAHVGENLLVIGLPLTFLLSLPSGSLPVAVRFLAAISGALAGLGLFAFLYALAATIWDGRERPDKWLWNAALFFLGLKAVAFLVVSLPAGAVWTLSMGLRISYLHWLLLGGVTVGLLAGARACWGREAAPFWRLMLLTIGLLIISLIPLTRLWPSGMGGRWILEFAAWASPGPVVVAAMMLLKSFIGKRKASMERWKVTSEAG